MAKKRFMFTKQDTFSNSIIIVDQQTGVNYLFVSQGYGGGLTPLLDSSGKVIVTPVDQAGKNGWNNSGKNDNTPDR